LQAELRARLEELRASRFRLVETADVERRRLERNLHDGAQQRLVALSLSLALAQREFGSYPAVIEMLERTRSDLADALAELRELARGIHPSLLTDRGLKAALEALANRSLVPVELDGLPDERLPDGVEAAAYYLVAEALTNVAKYARASMASVRVLRENGRVIVEVRDDGIGGADARRGSGLRGLADRVEALDGRLDLDSPPGAGTRIRAEIPCQDGAALQLPGADAVSRGAVAGT
jgi:signal transduction histidine kinase